MTKLSGRTEMLRVYRERSFTKEEMKNKSPDSVMWEWERVTRVYLSDERVLEKRDVKYAPSEFDPKGRKHTWGWKSKGKMSEHLDIKRLAERYENAGWKIIKPKDALW